MTAYHDRLEAGDYLPKKPKKPKTDKPADTTTSTTSSETKTSQ